MLDTEFCFCRSGWKIRSFADWAGGETRQSLSYCSGLRWGSVQNPWLPFSPNSHDTSKMYLSVSLQLSQAMSISSIHSFNKYLRCPYCVSGLPSWLKESACNAEDLGSIPGLRRSPGGGHGNLLQCLQCRRPGFDPWVEKIPWRRAWQTTPVFLPRESHEQRSLASYGPWGRKEVDMTEQPTHMGK